VRVHNQENKAWFDSSNGNPAFLILVGFIALGDRTRIIKHKRRRLECDIMLTTIDSALMLIPLKSHGRAPLTGYALAVITSIHLYIS
jgi:hypothetical protein